MTLSFLTALRDNRSMCTKKKIRAHFFLQCNFKTQYLIISVTRIVFEKWPKSKNYLSILMSYFAF
jgi:hypothetical protein